MSNQQPVLLAIVGDSAAGKTTMSAGIAKVIGEDQVTVIGSDDYHRYGRKMRAELDITPLNPECNHLDILAQHLTCLREGHPILKPVYNHSYGELDAPVYVEPRQFVIVEGLLGFYTRQLRNLFDVRVFLDPPLSLRTRWKVKRDVAERGYTEPEVIAAMRAREHDSKTHIAPQRSHADLVVVFSEPTGADGDDRHLDVTLVLRPTLAQPNLEAISTVTQPSPIRHRLGRDEGRPVDILAIDGTIDADRAREVEEAFFHHFGLGRGDLPPDMGRVNGGHSDPLALTQLLIASHMLSARRLVML